MGCKNSLYADSLTVNLSSKEQVDFVDNEGLLIKNPNAIFNFIGEPNLFFS